MTHGPHLASNGLLPGQKCPREKTSKQDEFICFKNWSFNVLFTCFLEMPQMTLCQVPSISGRNTLLSFIKSIMQYTWHECCFTSLMIITFCIVLAYEDLKTMLKMWSKAKTVVHYCSIWYIMTRRPTCFQSCSSFTGRNMNGGGSPPVPSGTTATAPTPLLYLRTQFAQMIWPSLLRSYHTAEPDTVCTHHTLTYMSFPH